MSSLLSCRIGCLQGACNPGGFPSSKLQASQTFSPPILMHAMIAAKTIWKSSFAFIGKKRRNLELDPEFLDLTCCRSSTVPPEGPHPVMSLLGACTNGLLKLLVNSAAAASRAATEQQLVPIASAAVRSLSSSTASSSSSTWNHNPHHIPEWTMPNLDIIPQHEIEQGETQATGGPASRGEGEGLRGKGEGLGGI